MLPDPADFTVDRDELGRIVREAWVLWAQGQPNVKPKHLVPYDELSAADKEADCFIGDQVVQYLYSRAVARRINDTERRLNA